MNKRKWFLKNRYCFILMTAFLLAIMAIPSVSKGAQSTEESSSITELEADTDYPVDLDGDGSKEKLSYQYTSSEDSSNSKIQIYVNDKLCYSKKSENCIFYVLQLLDLNETDNHPDLYLAGISDSGVVSYSQFLNYNGKKMTARVFNPKIPNKSLDFYRYSIDSLKGDNTFIVAADTPLYTEATGSYYCYITYRLKDNGIAAVNTTTFDFTPSSSTYKYKAKKAFTVYKKAGSKTVAYQVKKGNSITIDRIYIAKSGSVYVRTVNSKGKKGWINASQKNLFQELPSWG